VKFYEKTGHVPIWKLAEVIPQKNCGHGMCHHLKTHTIPPPAIWSALKILFLPFFTYLAGKKKGRRF
jgi:hypothetical protein